jgi:hypothetical protein
VSGELLAIAKSGMYNQLLALACLWVAPSRIRKLSVILKPSTLLTFHKLLVRKKYQLLFASTRKARLGPKGPSDESLPQYLR